MIKNLDELVKKGERVLPSEELFLDAIRDLMKDEIKEYIKEKMDENPHIKKEIREAMLIYMDAKVKEAEALTKLTKAIGELGIVALPPKSKQEIVEYIYRTFKKEIDEIIEKTL